MLGVDEADHCIIDCTDCRHYVGHGITGTQGMRVTVALRPEKITLTRDKPAGELGEFNHVRGTVKELSYFGSFTVYHLLLPSGALLKVSMANAQRNEAHFTWGDVLWAAWLPSAQVVLTQ